QRSVVWPDQSRADPLCERPCAPACQARHPRQCGVARHGLFRRWRVEHGREEHARLFQDGDGPQSDRPRGDTAGHRQCDGVPGESRIVLHDGRQSSGRWRNQPPREFLRQSGNAMAGKARGRKSIFITGAASGMGRETAKLFHGKGWFVGAYDVNTEGLATLAQEIGNDNCHTMRLDVTKKEDFDTAVKAFGEETDGKMDMLHSNAGIGESGWFEDIPFEAAMRVVQINFIGVIASIYAALPLLKNTKNSLVFITSSSSATYGMPRIAVYSATKHGVKG